MLMALLYCDEDRIAAAALACDQSPYGDSYWSEIHGGDIETGSVYETAYVTVVDRDLQKKLLQIGLDDEVDGTVLASEIEKMAAPVYQVDRAA